MRATTLALLLVLCACLGGAYSVYALGIGRGAARVPTPAIVAKPAKGTWHTSASFAYTDRWRYAGFQCSLDHARFTRCTSPMRYAGPIAPGIHTFRVRALGGSYRARKFSRPASYTWVIDLQPPRPYIARHPSDPNVAQSATFVFTDGEADVTFQCSIDTRPWRACTGHASYRGLRVGAHRFRVRALDPPAPASPPAQFDWHVIAQQGNTPEVGENFSITAGETAGGLLYPGAPSQAIALTLENPNDAPIFVTSVQVTVSGTQAGCDSATNISLTQSDVSDTAPIEVQGHGSVVLPAQGRSAPTIQLLDLPVNQDACQHAKFPLTFTGAAHS